MELTLVHIKLQFFRKVTSVSHQSSHLRYNLNVFSSFFFELHLLWHTNEEFEKEEKLC